MGKLVICCWTSPIAYCSILNQWIELSHWNRVRVLTLFHSRLTRLVYYSDNNTHYQISSSNRILLIFHCVIYRLLLNLSMILIRMDFDIEAMWDDTIFNKYSTPRFLFRGDIWRENIEENDTNNISCFLTLIRESINDIDFKIFSIYE